VSKKLAVIGSGLMGAGITQVAAQAGYDVVMRDVTEEALERGLSGITASYDKFVAKGQLAAEDAEELDPDTPSSLDDYPPEPAEPTKAEDVRASWDDVT